MRNAALAALALASALVAHTGCGCGAYEGGGNRAYERGSELLLLCENGGFVATLDTTMLEGRYSDNHAGHVTGFNGEDGAIAFELTDNQDGTAIAPTLGEGAWTSVALDMTAADHSNVLCNDLAMRAWWQPTTAQ